jgi:excinuclease UvrABC nuclease subunit
MAKITRLNDPDNPYAGKRPVVQAKDLKPAVVVVRKATPTKAGVAKAVTQTKNLVVGIANSMRDKGNSLMKNAQKNAADAKRQQIDDAIEGKQRPRK